MALAPRVMGGRPGGVFIGLAVGCERAFVIAALTPISRTVFLTLSMCIFQIVMYMK